MAFFYMNFLPQEVVSFLEVLTQSEDLVDQIFSADQTKAAQLFLDEFVVLELDSLSVDLSISSLVDEVRDSLLGWVSEGDEWLNFLKHFHGGVVKLDESGVVELWESQKSQGLLHVWVVLVDTSDSHNQCDLGFSWDIVVTVGLGLGLRGKSQLL